jgi:hypothetical protein
MFTQETTGSSSRTRSAHAAPPRAPPWAASSFSWVQRCSGRGHRRHGGWGVAPQGGLSDADKARLTVELNAGKAAVGVLAPVETAPAISDRLTQLGAASETHGLTQDALEAAAQ